MRTMVEQRIQQQFFESADLQYQAAEWLSRPLAEAVQAAVAGLTSGGRLLAAGLGTSAALAQLVAAGLAGRFERPRPPLAALALGADGVALGGGVLDDAAAGDSAAALRGLLARQVEALGQPGDLLLLIDPVGDHPALLAAVDTAHAKDMTVIALTGRSGGALKARLAETDVLLPVPHDRRARVQELHLLLLNGLCDAIDLQLLGEEDNA